MWHSIGLWMHGFLAGAISMLVVCVGGGAFIWWKWHVPLKASYETLKELRKKD